MKNQKLVLNELKKQVTQLQKKEEAARNQLRAALRKVKKLQQFASEITKTITSKKKRVKKRNSRK